MKSRNSRLYDFQKRIDSLSPERRTLFVQRLRHKNWIPSRKWAIPQLPRKKNSNSFPLSFAQQRLWLINQLEPASTAYNVAAAYRIEGLLNQQILEKSLNEIVRRHEVLRTTFSVVNGQPIQVVAPAMTLKLHMEDLQQFPESDREAEALKRGTEEVHRPFDLAKGPLLRVYLLKLAKEKHVLLITMHHIIIDDWSVRIFFRELWTLYEAFSIGKAALLADLPIQYADFATWQRQWLQGEVLNEQLSYWKYQLDGISIVNLPSDRPRPPVQTYKGARQTFELSKSLTDSLKILSQKQGVTLFMTLQAAFNVLLYRYSGQEDIVVGVPIANRNRSEIEFLVGFFTNTLVIRTDLSGNQNFFELLDQVREKNMAAHANQDLPFEKLVENLQPVRDISRNPLFQVMFSFQNEPLSRIELSDLTLDPLRVKKEISIFDLTIEIQNTTHGLKGALEYNTILFDADRIIRMCGHIKTLLEAIVENPEKQIVALPILTEAERHKILVEWNNTRFDYPGDICVHRMFERQVEQTPDAIAVVFEDKHLTYSELNACSNQLANYLKELGAGPEVLVGICMERSLEMVMGLIGIMKVGGAYVPIDPTYPRNRQAFLMKDAHVLILLTQEKLIETLPDHQAQVVSLDSDWDIISKFSAENPVGEVSPKNLAYVIHTSGSTGQPKGVQILHKSLFNFLMAMSRQLNFSDHDVLLAITTLSFDIAALELYLPLVTGAKTILLSREVAKDGLQLIEKLNQDDITIMQATPTTWRLLLDAGWKGNNKLKILCGGEVMSRNTALSLLDKGREIWNLYGPTEATVWSTSYQLRPDIEFHGIVSVGRPVANTQVYILDHHLQPVPIGVIGELYIGGAGLARGYLNRPDLTQEKFIPNPFSDDPDSRLFKTGDLVKYLPDGNIEFLGRADNQVKIRGFRIELSEIEAVLGKHPVLRESAVIVREETPDDKRLVAYVVPQPEEAIEINELRSFLKEQLPDYMVPSIFISLKTMPLTPNGKVDRKALLRLPGEGLKLSGEGLIAPRGPEEELLAQIWCSVLKLEQVGIHDNFFDIGGHSLLAFQVISQIRETFGVELPLRNLFRSPTIAEIAEQLVDACQKEPLPPIKPVGRHGPLPLSFAQQRLWLLEQLEPGNSVYNIPSATRIKGILNIVALEKSLNEILQRHEVLRTTFFNVNGEPRHLINSFEFRALHIVDISNFPEEERENEAIRLATIEAWQPFDLTQEPLFRIKLLRLAENDHVLLLTMHHIVSDGWSIGILHRELTILYQAFSTGKPSSLQELPIQYTDFAIWQRQQLTGAVLETQLDYWKKQLGQQMPVLELPTDRPRPPVQTYNGAQQTLLLSEALTKSLKDLSRKEGVTLFMTLLAAFKVVLMNYTGKEDISVGVPIANRNQKETESLIGFFINTLVMRTDMSGDPTSRQILTRVCKIALGAYAHQDLPFEKLVEELQPERDLSRSPLFQVLFNMLNYEYDQFDLHGLNVERFPISKFMSKFDLTVSVKEQNKRIKFYFVYNVDLFEETTIASMLDQFETLLENIVADSEQHISELRLLNKAKRLQLTTRGNLVRSKNPFIEFRKEDIDQSISARFEQQVENYPTNIAVKINNEEWTYGMLNNAANRIAAKILLLCPSREERIGLLFEHGTQMIAGIFAVLKAGKAYVPLDPSLPVKRIHHILNDSQIAALLTNNANNDLAKSLNNNGLQIINMDDIESDVPVDNINFPISPDTVAYILYTSGSTGSPKGVMQTHRNILGHIRNYSNGLHICNGDRMTLFSNYSFDAAMMDIMGALLNGAILCPMDLREKPSIRLSEWLIREKITIYHSTPTVYCYLISTLDKEEKLPEIRLVVLGGEEVYKNDVEAYKKHFSPNCLFVNTYGPTESTIALQYFIDHKTKITRNKIPIGYAVDNTEILLLNKTGEVTDVYGEIAIKSELITTGYWRRSEVMREVFLPDPDGGKNKIYRTGDMGRLLPDGSIEFRGRKDLQVKIRGFRVEPAEVESAILNHEAIRECVVTKSDNGQGDNDLIAYIVCNESFSSLSLRRYLKDVLPHYMIPSEFVQLDAIPIIHNGKTDYASLSLLSSGRTMNRHDYVPPVSSIEKEIAEIWQNVLCIEKVGLQDNFFDIGGHSLMVVQAISIIEKKIGIHIPFREFFNQTLRQFAASCEEKLSSRKNCYAGKKY